MQEITSDVKEVTNFLRLNADRTIADVRPMSRSGTPVGDKGLRRSAAAAACIGTRRSLPHLRRLHLRRRPFLSRRLHPSLSLVTGCRRPGCRRQPPGRAGRRSRSMDRKAISSGRSAAEKQSVRRMILGEIGDAAAAAATAAAPPSPRRFQLQRRRERERESGGGRRSSWTERCGLGPHTTQPSIQTTRLVVSAPPSLPRRSQFRGFPDQLG